MKITRVGAVLMRSPPWVLVRVFTDAGLVGLGEAYHGAGVHRIAVDPRLTRALLGRDPRDVVRLARDMGAAMSGSGFHQGAVVSAISGVEMALWDLPGQAAGVPIWQLFRGPPRLLAAQPAGDGAALPGPAALAPARERSPTHRRWRAGGSRPACLGIRLDDEVVRRHLREEHGFFPQARRHGTS